MEDFYYALRILMALCIFFLQLAFFTTRKVKALEELTWVSIPILLYYCAYYTVMCCIALVFGKICTSLLRIPRDNYEHGDSTLLVCNLFAPQSCGPMFQTICNKVLIFLNHEGLGYLKHISQSAYKRFPVT